MLGLAARILKVFIRVPHFVLQLFVLRDKENLDRFRRVGIQNYCRNTKAIHFLLQADSFYCVISIES